MMQTEGTRMTLEDKRELAFQIKELEKYIEEHRGCPEIPTQTKELRRLRRMRDQK